MTGEPEPDGVFPLPHGADEGIGDDSRVVVNRASALGLLAAVRTAKDAGVPYDGPKIPDNIRLGEN